MKKVLFRLFMVLILIAMLAGMILPVTAASANTKAVIVAPSIPLRPTTAPEQVEAYEAIPTPGSDPINWYGKPYGTWKAGNGTKYFLSDMTYLVSSNTTNSDYPYGKPTTVDYPYAMQPNDQFFFGEGDAAWVMAKGIGMHPKHPTWNPPNNIVNRADSWTIYDISAYTSEDSETPADTFYSLVGLTSETQRDVSEGVCVYIYGDKVGDGKHYKLLTASEVIKGYDIGEINVDVTDVKLLLIDVILPVGATTNTSSGIGFGNACLFMADDEAEKPDYRFDYCQEDAHVYINGFWENNSDKQHKMTCDCGEETKYEDHRMDDGVDSIDPTNELIGMTTYSCYLCEYQKVMTYDIVPETNESDAESEKTSDVATMEEMTISIPGCESVMGGALSMALVSLSAAWVTMKKKKSETED